MTVCNTTSDDEYDEYNLSEFSLTDLAAVDFSATSKELSQPSLAYPSPHPEPPLTQSQSCDEYDEYGDFDFSEFSASDLARIDSTTATLVSSPSQAYPSPPSDRSSQTTLTSAFSKSRDISRTSSLQSTPSLTSAGSSPSAIRHLIDAPSPYTLFRAWRKTLSVSDLVGPLWCEVQYDYGLRQRRWIELEKRPASFLTADNKVIQVDQKVAADNDRTLKSGSAIHEKLERRLRPDVVEVQVMNESERWALRLLQMIACLADIQTFGFCREMPSFGILHGHLVNGIIDEVGRKPWITTFRAKASTSATGPNGKRPLPTPSSPPKAKKQRPSLPTPATSAQQTRLTTFVAPSRNLSAEPDQPTYALHLSDTKTRRKQTLPTDEDATSARLQLMIYQRLLAGIISPSFPWAALWARLGVDPAEILCDEFLEQAMPLLPGVDKEKLVLKQFDTFPRTLNALVATFYKSFKELHVVHVDRTLEIVYRSQRSTRAQKRAAEDAALLQAALEDKLLREEGADPELARMIAANTVARKYPPSTRPTESVASAADAPSTTPEGASQSTITGSSQAEESAAPAQGSLIIAQNASVDAGPNGAVSSLTPAGTAGASGSNEASESSLALNAQSPATEQAGTSAATMDLQKAMEKRKEMADEEACDEESRIIGTKTFELDDELLDTHLTHVFAFWMGDRSPIGVSEENTRRCSSCEYMDGCEWREKKAREIEERLGFKRPTPIREDIESSDTVAAMF